MSKLYAAAAASAALSIVVVTQNCDGVVIGLGIGMAYAAVCRIIKFTTSSAAFRKIRDAPFVRVADLHSIASLSDGSESEHILVVRGTVAPKFVANTQYPPSIVAELSKKEGVIYERLQRNVYSGWASKIRPLIANDEYCSSTRRVPFVLSSGLPLKSGYLIVNMDGSNHPLPLATVYNEMHPISVFTHLLHAIFGLKPPIGTLVQEKILPSCIDITAIGYVSLKDGIAEIKSCKNLPYFLHHKSKFEMLEVLNLEVRVLLWSGIAFSSFAIGMFGYVAMRNWGRRREWILEQNEAPSEVEEELENGDDSPQVGEELEDD